MPAGIVSLYCAYLLYTALSSDPTSCNPNRAVRSNATLIVGLIISVLSLVYAGWNVGTSNTLFGGGKRII
jgi:serine incorporator 1/3